MNISKILQKFSKKIAIALIFICAIILLFWPLVDVLFPSLDPKTLVGLALGVAGVLVIDFYNVLSKLKPDSQVNLAHISISDGLKKVTQKQKYVKHLRILASSSETIFPIIRDITLDINVCDILLQDFSKLSDTKNQMMKSKCDAMINNWFGYKSQGFINTLEVHLYDFQPMQFIIIVDNSYLITGLFVPSKTESRVIDFTEPILIDNTTPSGKLTIIKYITQFDEIFSNYKSHILNN